MYTPQTIAIIGLGEKAKGIAHAFSAANVRVLVSSHGDNEAALLAGNLQQANPYYDVEATECSYNATWEADIILLDLPCAPLLEAAGYIKAVANQKIVITVNDSAQALQELLPNSKIIQAFTNVQEEAFYIPWKERRLIECFIAGKDEDALQTIIELVNAMGFNAVVASDTVQHDMKAA